MARMQRLVEQVGSSVAVPFALFGGWVALLVGALFAEGTTVGRVLFGHGAGVGIYVGLQLALTLATLAACVLVLWRGRARGRFLVLAPVAILVGYALMVIAGSG